MEDGTAENSAEDEPGAIGRPIERLEAKYVSCCIAFHPGFARILEVLVLVGKV